MKATTMTAFSFANTPQKAFAASPASHATRRPPLAVVDCFGILDDAKIRRFFELGCEVKGLGRGHIQRIKAEVRERQ